MCDSPFVRWEAGTRAQLHTCARVQGCCARNKREATTKKVMLHVFLCAGPILLAFIGGFLLHYNANDVGDSLTRLTQTAVDQVRSPCSCASEHVHV